MDERLFGEYRVEKPLGKGGMADVFEVEHVRLGSRHALKLFSCEGDDPWLKERFLHEGRMLAGLSHPRIVRVTDFGSDAETGRPYFVMDLVLSPDGSPETLADAKRGGVDGEQVAEWYEDVREGLNYVHSQGIVHRDLKMENVLVGPDGHAVISDFGISKIVDPAAKTRMSADFATTMMALKSGRAPLMGTRGYMAPELETGGSASPASDYYALGVMTLHLLTGAWYDRNVTDLRSVLEGYDSAWTEVLPKLLHSNPVARECPSFREAAAARHDAAELAAESALDAAEAGARRMRRLAVAASIVAVAAFCAVVGAWWSSKVQFKQQIEERDKELQQLRERDKELQQILEVRRAFAKAFPVPDNWNVSEEGFRAEDMKAGFEKICRASDLGPYLASSNLAEMIEAVVFEGSNGADDTAEFLLREGAMLARAKWGDLEDAKENFERFVEDYNWLPAYFVCDLSNRLVRAGVRFDEKAENAENAGGGR